MSESSRARPIWVDLLIHLRLNFQIILAPIFLWGFVLAGSAWGWRLVVGFIIAFLALLGILVSIILRLFGHAIVGQATTLISVLFLGGIQLIFLGIIGEYLGRIYDEVKRRPLYIVADSEGFGAADLERTPRPETPTHIATPRA